nr:unnamed protein product [Digitaria exilis]
MISTSRCTVSSPFLGSALQATSSPPALARQIRTEPNLPCPISSPSSYSLSSRFFRPIRVAESMHPSLRFSPRPGLSGAARPLAGGAVITTPPPRPAEAEEAAAAAAAAEQGFLFFFSGRGLGSRQVRLRAAAAGGASWRDPAASEHAPRAPLRFRGRESIAEGIGGLGGGGVLAPLACHGGGGERKLVVRDGGREGLGASEGLEEENGGR